MPTRRTILQLILAIGMASLARFDRRRTASPRLVEIDGWILREDDLS